MTKPQSEREIFLSRGKASVSRPIHPAVVRATPTVNGPITTGPGRRTYPRGWGWGWGITAADTTADPEGDD